MNSKILPEIVLASNNPGKIREFSAVMEPLGIRIIPQGDLNIPAALEPFGTFIENALAKARQACLASGKPSLADDSGICVQALMDAPGIYSARYAGEHANDASNNQKLITALQGIEQRAARYVCALVLLRHPNDPEPIIACADWHGEVIDTPRGHHGFGYDSYFWLPTLGKTVAELDPDLKNQISHRALALKILLPQIKAYTVQ